jgi:hypothetical protein
MPHNLLPLTPDDAMQIHPSSAIGAEFMKLPEALSNATIRALDIPRLTTIGAVISGATDSNSTSRAFVPVCHSAVSL